MNATKRKFNTLIQGIGARSPRVADPDDAHTPTRDDAASSHRLSAALSTPEAAARPSMSAWNTPSPSAELLGKRRRVGALEPTSPSPKTNTTKISNIVLKKWTPASATASATAKANASSEPPRYCPNDRDELIRRLATFQELTEWTPKPDKVNEIEWAKRGWVCQGRERVRCTLCHKELVVKTSTRTVDGKEVPVVAGSDVEQGLAKRFAELIIGAHEDDCLWRRHGCHDSLLRLPLAVPQAALSSLRERYDDLCTRPSFLPYSFNLRLPPTLDLKAVKSQLPLTFFTEPPPPSTNPSAPSDVALALALTGWQGLTNPRIGAVPNSATCATCLRRLGLWMFRSKEVDEATGAIVVPAPMDHLDPVREHRFFCPWRSPAVQRNPGARTKTGDDDDAAAKAAWEVLVLTLRNGAYLRREAERSGARRTLFHHRPAASLPGTPSRSRKLDGEAPVTPDQNFGDGDGEAEEEEEEEDMAARDAKDKERWAKLRRVKSLFDTKGRRRAQRALSRPGTASSSRPPTAHSRADGAAEKPGEKA
ncbi:zf-C3HC-domain-containing protein [Xylaria palmicola]|nr:zf-C3HC-domain-containing protein [Xylaria palmicola]